jgi:hypothetical protein
MQRLARSNAIFASRKLPIRDYLAAVAIFVNGAKGHAALRSRGDAELLSAAFTTPDRPRAVAIIPRHSHMMRSKAARRCPTT